ncbi:hypothetical protein NPIL_481221, partial [Nephila pilipes]
VDDGGLVGYVVALRGLAVVSPIDCLARVEDSALDPVFAMLFSLTNGFLVCATVVDRIGPCRFLVCVWLGAGNLPTFGYRHVVALIGFLSCFLINIQRMSLGVSIVAMVNQTKTNHFADYNSTIKVCPMRSKSHSTSLGGLQPRIEVISIRELAEQWVMKLSVVVHERLEFYWSSNKLVHHCLLRLGDGK